MDAGKKRAARRCAGQGGEAFGEVISHVEYVSRRQRDEHLAFARAENVLEGQMAFAFLGLEIARGERRQSRP